MTTSGVTPSNLRDTSNTIEGGKIATKSLAHKPIVLSLEVVKNIWRSYPTLPDTKKLASARVPPSSPQSSNALELNLGQQTVNEIHSVSYVSRSMQVCLSQRSKGSPSISMSHPKPDNQTTGGIDNDFGTPAAPSGQAGSPASERAVDDLLPTVPDSMDVSPSANNKPLSSFRAPPSPLNQTQQDRSRLPLSSGSGKLQPGSGSHSMLDVRSTLLESMSKVAHLRNPNTAVDYEKLTNRFATKLSDSEMRDIMQIGKEVIDQLRRSGKMEDVKRKYTSDNDENTQRRTRRRLESPVPGPSVTAQDDLKKYQSAQDSGNTTRTTSNIANNLNHIPPPGAPRAPRAMLSNDWRDIPPRVPPSLPHMAPRYSTPPPQRDGISLEPLSPGQILEDEPMSVSTAPSAPLSPQSIRTSSALPVTTSITINRLEPPHKNASGDAAEAKNDTEAMATPLEDNPLQDPSTTRILLAKIGNPSAGLLNASFDLDNQLVTAIRRWTERSKQFKYVVILLSHNYV